MRMSRVFLYLLIFSQCSCKTTHCVEDKTSTERFKKNVGLIKAYEEKNTEVYVDEYREALLFLSNVTGIITRAEYSSTFGYRDKVKYKEDITAWEKWLNKNKCKLTQRNIDSAMAQVRK